jgi:hypothetical protein
MATAKRVITCARAFLDRVRSQIPYKYGWRRAANLSTF